MHFVKFRSIETFRNIARVVSGALLLRDIDVQLVTSILERRLRSVLF